MTSKAPSGDPVNEAQITTETQDRLLEPRLTPEELADALKVKPYLVRRIPAEELPYELYGRQRRYLRSDVAKYVESRRRTGGAE